MTRVIKARMREDAVTMTLRRIGKFFNKTVKRGFSFAAMISKYTSARLRRHQFALPLITLLFSSQN